MINNQNHNKVAPQSEVKKFEFTSSFNDKSSPNKTESNLYRSLNSWNNSSIENIPSSTPTFESDIKIKENNTFKDEQNHLKEETILNQINPGNINYKAVQIIMTTWMGLLH